MQQDLLPLFPLRLVLLPETHLALHIFEERYKEMIGEAIRKKSEFGVVLASDKGVVNSGCTAVVDRVVKRYDDGRMDILVVGRRRFVILELNQEKEYLRGEVEFFDDEDSRSAAPDVQSKVEALFEQLQKLEPEAGDPSAGPGSRLSFRVGQSISDLNFRQVLLSTRSEPERMQRLLEYLPGLTDKLRISAQVRSVAPSNGHGKHLEI